MVHDLIQDREVVLGSASERRYQLLRQIGVEPIVITVDADERMSGDTPENLAMRNAEFKNSLIRDKYSGDGIIVTADTIVVLEKHIFGKPGNEEEAGNILRMLSGKRHRVITGLSVYNAKTGAGRNGKEVTEVCFSDLSEDDIQEYIQTGEPFDKAGAYGIQGYAAQFIEGVSGCYFNVVGFPIALFYKLLRECINV